MYMYIYIYMYNLLLYLSICVCAVSPITHVHTLLRMTFVKDIKNTWAKVAEMMGIETSNPA